MKRAVIYARYSSHNQTEQSIEGQIRVCREYAVKNDLSVVDQYCDRAISGKSDNRPAFLQMIQDGKAGKFDAVIVYKTDRFARNMYDSAIYKKILKDAGISIYYAAENIPEGPEGIILTALMEGLAEYYSAELAQKISRGMRESALKGQSVGGGRPFGYDIGSDKRFTVNQAEAEAVRYIFKAFIAGDPYADICNWLNEHGYKTKRGQPFNKNSLPRIVTNIKYVGIYRVGEIQLTDAVPAIVDAETFKQAQEEFARRANHRKPLGVKMNYLLSGKLFCGQCGKSMAGVSSTGSKGKKYYYYTCPDNRGKNKTCDLERVSKNWLEDLVIDETINKVLSDPMIELITVKLCEYQAKAAKQETAEAAYIREKLTKNEKCITKYLRLIEETDLPPKSINERLRELENEQENLQNALRHAETRPVQFSKDEIHLLLTNLKNVSRGPDFRAKILKAFVYRVELYKNKVVIQYNFHLNGKPDLFSRSIEFDATTDTSAPPVVLSSHWGLALVRRRLTLIVNIK